MSCENKRVRRLFVVGASGQLAGALLRASAAAGISAVALGRPRLDVTDGTGIADAIRAMRPDLVVNTAAYTAVDAAEDDPESAFRVNAEGAATVAEACARAGIALVHLSTDYVFDGCKGAPYLERDAPAARNVYGRSKHAGEIAVAQRTERHLILRTAWLYGPSGRNFVRTVLQRARVQTQLRVVDDQKGNPTSADDLAAALMRIARHLNEDIGWGTYHLAADGEASWRSFAEAVFAGARARGGPAAKIVPVTTMEYGAKAERPADSRLDCGKFRQRFGFGLADWRDGLSRCLDAMAASGWRLD